jgi:thiol-disulfide isomerase/thioredoxin
MIPDITLSNCAGEMVSLHERLCQKNAAMIYFSAGWCQPCAEKMPKLEELHQKYGDDIEIWVAMRENSGPQDPATKVFCNEWTEEFELSLPVLIDPTDKHTGSFLKAGTTYPVTVMVSSDGVIQAIETGSDVDLESYIQALLD